MPDISLIVSTIGRELELARLLESLLTEETFRFEIILVDQSNDEIAQANISRLAATHSKELKIIHIVDLGRGLSRARNIGLRMASGKIIAFPDDDCWYSGRVISTVRSYFKTHPQIAILSGPYSEPGRTNPAFPSHSLSLNLNNFIGKTSSVGLFINTTALLEPVIYFDERIGAGTDMPVGEETDLVMRLLFQGAQAQYEPDILVYHAIYREKSSSAISYVAMKRAFWYIIGKNYSPLWTEARFLRGVASSLLKPTHFGRGLDLKAMLDGFLEGLSERSNTRSQKTT